MDANFFTGEGCNCIHDSTFHILWIWAMDKSHNNIYLVKFLSFLATFLRKSSNITLMNAFIKTNLLADLCVFVKSRLITIDTRIKENCLFFFNQFMTMLELTFDRGDCKQFACETKKSLNYKFLHSAWKNEWREVPEMTSEPKPRKYSPPTNTKRNIDSPVRSGGVSFDLQSTQQMLQSPKSLLSLNPAAQILGVKEKPATKPETPISQIKANPSHFAEQVKPQTQGHPQVVKSPSMAKFARLPPPPLMQAKLTFASKK